MNARSSLGASLGAALPGLFVSLVPKCPLCLAAYASLFGGAAVDWLPRSLLPTVWPAVLGLLAASLAFAFYRALVRRQLRVFAVAFSGAALMIAARLFDGPRPLVLLGYAALVGGMFWLRTRQRSCP